MFIGKVAGSCDENNKIKVPAAYEELRQGRVVITQGFDRNILVLPVDVFEILARLLMALNIADPIARSLQRMLIGRASYSEIDETGRLALPVGLKDFTGMDTEAVWVGQGKYVEIWSQAHWRVQELAIEDVETNPMRFSSIHIAAV